MTYKKYESYAKINHTAHHALRPEYDRTRAGDARD